MVPGSFEVKMWRSYYDFKILECIFNTVINLWLGSFVLTHSSFCFLKVFYFKIHHTYKNVSTCSKAYAGFKEQQWNTYLGTRTASDTEL